MTNPVTPTALAPFELPEEDFKKLAWALVFGGLKGGLAKSTSSWLTGVELARRTGDVVLVVCADPLSQTLSTAYRASQAQEYEVPFHMVQWPTPDGFVTGVRKEMQKVGARHLIVDVGGESPKILEQACILVGSLAEDAETTSELIIPTAPNVPELWRLQSTIDAAARVESLSPEPPAVNLMLVKSPHRSADAREAREYFAQQGWPVLGTQIPDTTFYKRCMKHVPDDGGWYGSMLAEIAIERLEEAA